MSATVQPITESQFFAPASTKGKELIPGFSHTYSRVYENQFRGASVDTVIVKMEAA